jgi:hypothetical protein
MAAQQWWNAARIHPGISELLKHAHGQVIRRMSAKLYKRRQSAPFRIPKISHVTASKTRDGVNPHIAINNFN